MDDRQVVAAANASGAAIFLVINNLLSPEEANAGVGEQAGAMWRQWGHYPRSSPSSSIVTLGLDPRALFLNRREMAGYTYILANHPRGKLYVGVTNDLVRRVYEHREGLAEGYTKKHNIKQLVHFDVHATVPLAIQREKNLKHWVRAWKIALIEENNPEWNDLWYEIIK